MFQKPIQHFFQEIINLDEESDFKEFLIMNKENIDSFLELQDKDTEFALICNCTAVANHAQHMMYRLLNEAFSLLYFDDGFLAENVLPPTPDQRGEISEERKTTPLYDTLEKFIQESDLDAHRFSILRAYKKINNIK